MIDRNKRSFAVLRESVLLYLNRTQFLRHVQDIDMKYQIQMNMEMISFKCLTILNGMARISVKRQGSTGVLDYAHDIVTSGLVGPAFNSILRTTNSNIQSMATNLLNNLSRAGKLTFIYIFYEID